MQTALQQLTRCRFIVQGFVLTVQVYSYTVSALLARGMLLHGHVCVYSMAVTVSCALLSSVVSCVCVDCTGSGDVLILWAIELLHIQCGLPQRAP